METYNAVVSALQNTPREILGFGLGFLCCLLFVWVRLRIWMAGLNGRLDAISKLEFRVTGDMQLFKPTPDPDNQTTDPLSGHP